MVRAHLVQMRSLNENFLRMQNSSVKGSTREIYTADSKLRAANGQYTGDIRLDAVRAFPHNSPILYDSKQLSAITGTGVRTAHFTRSACKPWCTCRCHILRQWRSAPQLSDIFGCMYVSYSGVPGMHLECDSRSCRLPSQPVAFATYFFPPWLLARAISLMLSVTPLAGPVASLKVQRTVPGDAAIFTYAKLGDVNKIKSLFKQGLASPHDVSYRSGVTALHVRSHLLSMYTHYLIDGR